MAAIKGCEYHCLGKFDPAGSTTYTKVSVDPYYIYFTDGSNIKVTGVKDSVCLGFEDATCVKEFNWLAIQYATDFDWIDGLLGLASRNTERAKILDRNTNYLNALKEAGVISEKRVSFYIPTYGTPIHTDFGPANPNSIRSGESFVTIPITNNEIYGVYWSATVDAYRFPEYQTSIFTFEPRFGVFNTGNSCIQGPSSLVTKIISNILKNVEVTRTDKYRGKVFNCNDF